jgi:hypothetical protein
VLARRSESDAVAKEGAGAERQSDSVAIPALCKCWEGGRIPAGRRPSKPFRDRPACNNTRNTVS